MSGTTDYLENLNPEQRRAIEHGSAKATSAPGHVFAYTGAFMGKRAEPKFLLLMHRPTLDHRLNDLVPQRRRKVGDRDPDHAAITGSVAKPFRRAKIKTEASRMAQRQSGLFQVAAQLSRRLLRLLLV